jgi:hypothetical protein
MLAASAGKQQTDSAKYSSNQIARTVHSVSNIHMATGFRRSALNDALNAGNLYTFVMSWCHTISFVSGRPVKPGHFVRLRDGSLLFQRIKILTGKDKRFKRIQYFGYCKNQWAISDRLG